MLCFAVNICRHWFTAVRLTCLLTFCGISSSVQQFYLPITVRCMVIDSIYIYILRLRTSIMIFIKVWNNEFDEKYWLPKHGFLSVNKILLSNPILMMFWKDFHFWPTQMAKNKWETIFYALMIWNVMVFICLIEIKN